MKIYPQLLALFLVSVVFVSCDYAKYPIDNPPKVKIDTRLLGRWQEKSKKEEYKITKQTDFKYTILSTSLKDGKTETYPAYLSDVGNAQFLNVYVKDETTDGYVFVRILDINAAGTIARVTSVADSTLKDINDPAEVRKRITSRLNDPKFYGDTAHLYKIK